ncbi:MAG: MFS transporter [Pseudomonadota bacterium]|uniref:MFS transporter n=1 Tax=Candidatus Desulfatibia profunda TaxID=2841695 RepID=A0A8J6NRG2_9BACT|nr:MFS transporter [Candidatus Desulfatibia profunda]MBL7179543.1 MFS transporter [Desulfobacterales bacterium]
MDKVINHSFKIVIASQYFIYFGVMGIFLPYFNLYCYHLDFSGFQIGLLSALRSVVTIMFALIWSALADRFQIRKPLYILCNFISTAIWAFYFFSTDFKAMLVITIFYAVFYAPIISFLEAFTMDVLGAEKKSYGRLRVWGSMAFIITVIALGRIIDLYSVEVIIALIFCGSLIQAAVSTKIPGMRIEKEAAFTLKAGVLCKRRVVVFLFCAFLMLVSHGAYYGFFSIHLENIGYGNTFIGIAWALATIAEITVMIKSDWIFKRFSMENVLIFSFMVAAFRWFALSWATSPPAILILQLLHALTYGTFHVASILYIDSLTPAEAKTLGQAANNAVTYGLGLMVGFFVSGYFFESLGSFRLFFISGFIALGGGLLFKGFQVMEHRGRC